MKHTKWRAVFRIGFVFLFVAIYAIAALLFGIAPAPSVSREFNQPQIFSEGLSPQISLHPPTLRTDSKLEFNIESFYFTYEPKGVKINQICIDSIRYNEYLLELQGIGTGPVNAEYPLCYPITNYIHRRFLPDGTKDTYTFELNQKDKVEASINDLYQGSGRFLYPYDNFNTNFSVQISYRLLNNSQVISDTTVSPELNIFTPDTFGWNIDIDSSAVHNPTPPIKAVNDIENITTIHFGRSNFERWIYPSIIGIMFLFIILLALEEPGGSVLEGGAAVFFGIFAIKQILLPESQIVTILDVAIWGLYFAFAGAFIPHIFRREAINDKEQQNLSKDVSIDPKGNVSKASTVKYSLLLGLCIAILAAVQHFLSRKTP